MNLNNNTLTDTQKDSISKVESYMDELFFSFYYEEGDKYPELKSLLNDLMSQGIEFTCSTPHYFVDEEGTTTDCKVMLQGGCYNPPFLLY